MGNAASNDSSERTNRLIRYIVEHTHHEFGKQYFRLLVRHLAEALEVSGAWVTEYLEKEQKLRSLAFWINSKYVDHYEYELKNTPCELVITAKECFLVPEKVIQLFPKDPDLKPYNAVSYLGYPMFNERQDVIGHMAILHTAPLQPNKEQEAIFNLFVQRANAEFLRYKIHEQLLEKKLKLATLVGSVHDAIVEMDVLGFITLVNPAANLLFGLSDVELTGYLVFSLFDEESSASLRQILKEIRENGSNSKPTTLRKELHCFHANGEIIPTEASFCHYEVKSTTYLTLSLRDIKELRRAEQRIEIMEEKPVPNGKGISSGIIGQCKPLMKVMDDLLQVAPSNSTILLMGETGTGKEVFAGYVHELSPRREKPMIKVNCAAIPANLIESEFFGHEKGAFTGALARREGRFSLADGGTLFLDEVGELPLEMQPKLLRVLQEGEFEMVGGQRTLKVNVRIIAATNRDLEAMVKSGTFREDLYYRLNVIPVALPPLRERGDDILLLAEMFIKKFSRQLRKRILPLSPVSTHLLLHYPWPGNIRELEHVIERSVLLSKDGQLDLQRFLPGNSLTFQDITINTSYIPEGKVLRMSELEYLERENIINALQLTSWKISGTNGAASLLDIPPSTLNSKIKALGLKKPL